MMVMVESQRRVCAHLGQDPTCLHTFINEYQTSEVGPKDIDTSAADGWHPFANFNEDNRDVEHGDPSLQR